MRTLAQRIAGAIALLCLAACQTPVRPDAPATMSSAASSEPASAPAPVQPESSPAAPKPEADASAPAPTPRPRTGADVFAQLEASLADPPCVQDRVVQRWEKTYGRWAPRFSSNLEAILPLMAMVLDELQTHHLPGEFALLPIVESWYRPDAGSSRTAYGMWQFTTATARHQGLRIVPGYDERLAPRASTRAAMRYLAELQNRFGDWRLANMAYNAGEYRVMRVVARSSRPGRPAAASHLPAGLSTTTYEHLAKIQALACLIAEPERFGLSLPLAVEVPALEATTIPPAFLSLDAFAADRGLAPEAVQRLNPAFLDGRIVAEARREVLLPAGATITGKQTATASAADVGATATHAAPRHYEVRRGDTLGAIASRHRVRLADLLRWNRLDVRSLIHPGQRLRLEP